MAVGVPDIVPKVPSLLAAGGAGVALVGGMMIKDFVAKSQLNFDGWGGPVVLGLLSGVAFAFARQFGPLAVGVGIAFLLIALVLLARKFGLNIGPLTV